MPAPKKYMVKFTADGYTGTVTVQGCKGPDDAKAHVMQLHHQDIAHAWDEGQEGLPAKDEIHDLYGNKMMNPNVPGSPVKEGRKFKLPLTITSVERFFTDQEKAIFSDMGVALPVE